MSFQTQNKMHFWHFRIMAWNKKIKIVHYPNGSQRIDFFCERFFFFPGCQVNRRIFKKITNSKSILIFAKTKCIYQLKKKVWKKDKSWGLRIFISIHDFFWNYGFLLPLVKSVSAGLYAKFFSEYHEKFQMIRNYDSTIWHSHSFSKIQTQS